MEIPIIRDVLEESNAIAKQNRILFEQYGVFVVNMMSSPGAGKTTLLRKTIPFLKALGIRCAVIEGDIATTIDSEQLKPLDIPIVQANTEPFGGDCHIGSHLINAALKFIDLKDIDILFIENVGNLVCPAEFYLGENRKMVMLSLPEGEDKPLKYPLMFRQCQLCVISKIDLAPHLNIELNTLNSNIHLINGSLDILFLSAVTGEGVSGWIDWLIKQIKLKNSS